MILMLISLGMDWVQNYSYSSPLELRTIILNKGFLTTLFCAGTLIVTNLLIKKEIVEASNADIVIEYHGLSFNGRNYTRVLRILVIALFYLIGMFELFYQFQHRTVLDAAPYIVALTYHLLFLLLLNYNYAKTEILYAKNTLLFVNLLTMTLFVALGIILPLNDFTENLVSANRNFIGCIFHYVNIAAALFVARQTWQQLKQSNSITGTVSFGPPALIMASVVYLLSVELILHVGLLRLHPVGTVDALAALDKLTEYENLRRHVVKIGFPILWGLIAFAFLSVGLRRKIRHLRVGALVLIAIILVKLFTYDISHASEAGKIIAFIILGIVLLVISFLYQKIRALVADDTKDKIDSIENKNENIN
jgi:hypothetical protein